MLPPLAVAQFRGPWVRHLRHPREAAPVSRTQIFISYAREDADEAAQIYSLLERHPSLDVWFDQVSLKPGCDWEFEILRALESCSFVLLLLSQEAVRKTGFVQREVRFALDEAKKRPPSTPFIIPARLDECTPEYRDLNRMQRVDLFPQFEVGFSRLCEVFGVAPYTHVYVAHGNHKGGEAELVQIGSTLNVDNAGTKLVCVRELPSLDPAQVPDRGMVRDGAPKSIFLKLWTIASSDWPQMLYRKRDWNLLDSLLFRENRSEPEKGRLVEVLIRQWALARELRPYDEDDWRAVRKLIQKPQYE